MTQRTLAGLLAVPLLLALWAVAVFTPLPFVTYEPGLTVDVLGDPDGEEIIQVSGHRTYRDGGELRMTTVFVTQPNTDVNLFDLMEGWISPDAAVLPYSAVYQPEETQESNEIEGAIAMVSSQDAAIAVALTELGVDFDKAIKVFRVADGCAGHGQAEARRCRRCASTESRSPPPRGGVTRSRPRRRVRRSSSRCCARAPSARSR